ncbi:uncharacterized protein BYT42DRAFT_587925 [Radiomyces spectabilis]|uniref:uncharacterized protein n=1 Tax=Radiomyces spectabilis TaxID=64574 RepID=UPI00221E430C|nr:uncharacterized protein BYT42DRAFT_587925 [Radiomyces spectabilis]KAI8366806.1 hypothetical protein BYT42DRAFT_587925 [Radiomyces spectabilis]
MSRKNTAEDAFPDDDAANTEVLEGGNRSIIMGIISQMRKDMDLSRVTLPTFVLEPRSMLEKITDFMSHPDLCIQASRMTDPVERFVAVTKYFLSGWHVKAKGVKKPYNPVLGEFFRCQWRFDDGTEASYVAEQVSHHPPISAYHYENPKHGIYIQGEAHPKAKFLGNSAATIMKGYSRITFAHLHNETYDITNPNVYARGILFGKMIMELGDQCMVRCVTSDLVCELDFKTKGFFSGHYHGVIGKIKKESTGEVLYEISGTWANELFIKSTKSSAKESFFNVKTASIHAKLVQDEKDQEPLESRRLWSKVTAAIKCNDMDTATEEKTLIENRQREEAAARQKEGVQWNPRFFRLNKNEEYEFKEQTP